MTTTETNSAEEAPDSLAERVNNRSRRPSSDAFREFMGSQWGPRPDPSITRDRPLPTTFPRAQLQPESLSPVNDW